MSIVRNGTMKLVRECEVGDFIKFREDGATIAGFVIRSDDGDVSVITAHPPHDGLPTWWNVGAPTVLSYGNGWRMEPVIGIDPWETANLAPGMLLLLPDADVLAFSRDGRNPVLEMLDMRTWRAIQRNPGRGVIVGRWRVWASEEERLRPGATPVFEFPAA